MQPFSVLLDSPAGTANRLQIAKLGSFKDKRYGEFAITRHDVESWKRNLEHLPGQRALIDLDHRADRTPRNTEAAGWITGIGFDGDTPVADVEWTPVGQKAIEEKRYLFFSPTYGEHKTEDGSVHDNTLIGGALTNRPFLGMPTITLASEERVSEAYDQDPAASLYARMLDGDFGELGEAVLTLDGVTQAERDRAKANNNSLPDGSYPINNPKQLHAAAVLAASKHGDWQAAQRLIRRRAKELGVDVTTLPGFGPKTMDSRAPSMPNELLTALSLDADSELAKTLDGLDEDAQKALLEALPKQPEQTGEVKTLEEQAREQGMIILDAATVQQLQTDAAAGADAKKELHEQRFETAFDAAIHDGKVIPAERDSLHHFYTLDADATLKAMDERQAVIQTQPTGVPVLDLERDTPEDPRRLEAAGVHPDGRDDYTKVMRKLRESNLGPDKFTEVYTRMLESGELGARSL